VNELLWVVYPYVALTVLVVGTLARYNYDQYGWSAKSSEFLEKRLLRWGSLLFHWGIVFVFLGHVAGLLVPLRAYRAIGVPDHLYHLAATLGGGLAGLMAVVGLVLLLVRRLLVKRVLRTTAPMDFLALGLLLVTAALGLAMTLAHGVAAVPYEYRATVGPWIRGILLLQPKPALMAGVPLLLKLHILAALALVAVSPCTRLVHIWSAPLAYPRRAPIQYRRRAPAAGGGTGDATPGP